MSANNVNNPVSFIDATSAAAGKLLPDENNRKGGIFTNTSSSVVAYVATGITLEDAIAKCVPKLSATLNPGSAQNFGISDKHVYWAAVTESGAATITLQSGQDS